MSEEEIESDEDDESGPPYQCISREAMQKLFEMRLNNQLCDAEIHCLADNKFLNVHRTMMCACSMYFKYVEIV